MLKGGSHSSRISAWPGVTVQQAWAAVVGVLEGDAMNEKGFGVSEVSEKRCMP
jgi:hypothetical protein